MAVAEKGLMVLDGIAKGKSGHAARDEGTNAMYAAMKDIDWFQHYSFLKVSDLLGPVHMAVTNIETPNKAHNVVPDECNFIVDVRVNELYKFVEVLDIIKQNVASEIVPRSLRLRPSFIPEKHPLVIAGKNNGLSSYGSPTLSDMALMNFPALKIGPGESERSHSADEFIYLQEIKEGIATYISLIESFSDELKKTGKNL
jgi:acetylornithine deacetylase